MYMASRGVSTASGQANSNLITYTNSTLTYVQVLWLGKIEERKKMWLISNKQFNINLFWYAHFHKFP